jgi:hypothetical protein
MPVIPALGRPRQEDLEFKASLIYIARPAKKRRDKEEKGLPSFIFLSTRSRLANSRHIRGVFLWLGLSQHGPGFHTGQSGLQY